MSGSISDQIQKCFETEEGYKQYSDVIANWVGDTSKNLKLQQPIVNAIKVTIKSKTHSSLQKLLALRLLNKCFLQKNKEFNKYVEKKILKRLGVFAQFNKDKNTEQDILYKGEFIFSGMEKDRRSGASFLVLLLDCIESWSKIMSLSDDNKSPSQFVKTYVALQQKKIMFPSQCRSNPLSALGLHEEAKNMKSPAPQQQQSSSSKSEFKTSQNQQNNVQQKIDAPKMAEELKKKMLKAKDVSRKSEAFLAKLERSGFQADPSELVEMEQLLQIGKEQCEFCIQALMSEEIGPIISNKEELLDRMFKYQEQILTSIAITQPIADSLKQQEVAAYKTFQNKRGTQVTSINKLTMNTSSQQSKTNHKSAKNEESKADEGGDLWSNLDQFATGFQKQGNVAGIPQVDKDDPFAEAILENYQKMQNEQQQPQQPKNDDFFAGFNQQQQSQSQNNYNFDFPQNNNNQQLQVQNQEQEHNAYNQSPQNQYENDPDLEPKIVQPEEEKIKVGGADNYSLFRMIHDGTIDIEKEKVSRKKGNEQQQQNNNQYQNQYNDNQNNQYNDNNYYDNSQQQYNNPQQQQNIYQAPVQQQQQQQENYGRNLWDDGIQEQFSDNPFQGNDAGRNKIGDLEKQIQSLKRQNTELLTSNHMLKERLEQYKNTGSSYNKDDISLQNQQLEMQLNNQREYYERELDSKDQQLRQKDYEISELKQEVRALRSRQSIPGNNGQDNSQRNQNNNLQEEYKSNDKNVYASPQNAHNDNSSDKFNSHKSAQMIHETKLEYKSNSSSGIKPVSVKDDSPSHSDDDQLPLYESRPDDYDKKIETLFFKSLFSDKMLIFEDQNLQIGCIRSVSVEWRSATLKLFLNNKNQSKELSNIYFQKDAPFITIRNEDQFPFHIDPKEQLEVQIYIAVQMHTQPFVYLSYQCGEVQSEQVKLKLPVNAIYFCEPFVVTSNQFKQLWTFSKYPRAMRFNLNLARAGNLQAVKKILTINEKYGAFIQNIDVKPNIVGFSANHLEGQVLGMLEISANGSNCVLQIKSEISEEFSQNILETFLDLLAAK